MSEQLDANLDWSTLQLGSFGFGPIKVAIPAGLTEYQTTVTYQNIDGTPLNVDVAIAFNVQTGLLTATFTSLDPSTGETPTGLLDGFLYPDNKNGVGEGYVQYTIHPKAGLTTGAAVHQQAAVVFDINSPLTTAPAVNTIDSGPPTSSVTALPPTESTTFTVSWTGQDDSGGSGITFYDLYVSDNGGPFTLWLGQTTQTSASFTGMVGHAFGFYSVATDHVGNRQPTPPAAQATTTVGTATLMATAPTGPFLATEGQTSAVQNLATFTDGGGAGSLSDYAVSVDWGDGNGFTSDPSVTISGPVNGVFTISGSHRYGEEDGFTGMIKLKVVHGGTTSNTVSMGVQVTDPPVVATKLAVSTTAGGPFNGAMATFTDLAGAEAPDGTHYTATIAWGDNTPTTAGTITLANGTFTVSGTHAYAAAGSYTMTMTINHEATSTPVQITVGVASLGQFVPTGWTKPISFWAGLQGQSLLHRFGLTSAGQSLGQWLAMAFPNLYGGQNGAPNLSPFSNAQISSYFQSLFLASKGVGLDAEVLATALEVFTTTTSLGGSVGQSYGFTVTDNGLGAYSWNIGISGQAFGVPNNTILNVYQILLAANNAAASGEPWGTNSFLRNEAFSVLHGVNGGYSQPSSSVQRWNAGRTPRQKSLILVPHGAQ